MFNIAICDDEHYFRENIKEAVKSYMRRHGAPFHIDTFATGKAFIGLGIEIHQYKIVFLDINMDEIHGIQDDKSEIRIGDPIGGYNGNAHPTFYNKTAAQASNVCSRIVW